MSSSTKVANEYLANLRIINCQLKRISGGMKSVKYLQQSGTNFASTKVRNFGNFKFSTWLVRLI